MIPRRSQPAPPRRILVVTLADLGDALLTTPALLALRQAFPQAHIAVLTTVGGAQALRSLPVHDELILFPKHRFDRPQALLRPTNMLAALRLAAQIRAVRADVCLILHHLTTAFGALKYAALALASGASRRVGRDNGRGWFLTDRVADGGFGSRHQASYWLDLVALLGAHAQPLPRFAVSPADAAQAETILGSFGAAAQPLVALHPGSGGFAPARRWPTVRFAALADALVDDGVRLVLVGGPEEAELRATLLSAMQHASAVLDLGGRTSLGVLAGVLQRCRMLVGNDSGVAHLASAVGTPVVAIFGPTDPRAYGPYGGADWQITSELPDGVAVLQSGAHRALKAEIACSPCIYRGQRLGTPAGCPDRTCLQRIDVAAPLALIRRRIHELSEPACASTI